MFRVVTLIKVYHSNIFCARFDILLWQLKYPESLNYAIIQIKFIYRMQYLFKANMMNSFTIQCNVFYTAKSKGI